MIMWVKLIKLKDMLKMLVFAFTFKIIHFLLQLTFAPLFALMQAIAEWIREIYKLKVKMLLQ